MPEPTVIDAPASADAWPVTPPAGGGRKPTASERADQALEGIQALSARLEEVAAQVPTVNADGAVVAGVSEERFAALSHDLDALVEAFNGQAQQLANVATAAAAPDPTAAAALEKLREDIRATLAEIRTVDAPVTVVADELQSVRQEQLSLSQEVARLLDGLGVRLAKLEQRPGPVAGQALPSRETSAPLVYAAVHRLMCRVPELGKTGSAPASAGGFKFRGIEAVMDAIGSAMREPEIGLILRTEIVRCDVSRETVNGRTWTSTDMVTRFVFVHPADGSEHPFEMAGEGRDLGDKASSKAASMAAKYALCQALMIPFNGMADSDQEDSATQQAQEWERNQERERQVAHAREQERAQQRQRPTETSSPAPADDPWASAPSAAYEQAGPDHPIGKAERAAAAVAALDKLSTFPLAEARQRWEKISAQVQDEGLAGEMVSGSNLQLHLEMHRQLLIRASANG